jgi:hypothetical protein
MVVIQDIVERESIEFQADAKTSDFFSIAMFCGIGLLVSLSVLLLTSTFRVTGSNAHRSSFG